MADQQQDVKKKGIYEQWTEEESKLLLEFMVDAAARGWCDNSGILRKQIVEEMILPILNKKLGIQKTYKNYQSGLKWFKNKWSSYLTLMRFSSDFRYDSTTKKFTACDEVWEEYFKAHPKNTELKYGTFEDYEDLEIAIGNGVAIGKNSIGLGSATNARTLGASESIEVSIEDLEYDVDSNAFIRPNHNDTSFHSTSPLRSLEFLKNECKEKQNTSAASSSYTTECCFECGKIGRWVRYCPWKETKCPSGCEGARKLWTSEQDRSYGDNFLKCLKCCHFEWLKSAKCRKINVRVKLEVDLDDICNQFENLSPNSTPISLFVISFLSHPQLELGGKPGFRGSESMHPQLRDLASLSFAGQASRIDACESSSL
ncbi:hypothetical protein LguiA_021449 [Lonicera macranthoides]